MPFILLLLTKCSCSMQPLQYSNESIRDVLDDAKHTTMEWTNSRLALLIM